MAEVARALAAEKVNADAIAALDSKATGDAGAVAANLTIEIARATAAEQANADAITAEQSCQTAEQANADAISAEETRAQAAEQVNATAIADETSRARAAERGISENLTSEIARAEAAEQANATAIADETSRAQAAEQANATAISTNVADIATKLNHTDGSHTGTFTVSNTEGGTALSVQSGRLSAKEVKVDEDSYLYFGNKWRVKGSSDGSRLQFEFDTGSAWEVAVPFITTLSGGGGGGDV